MPVKLQAFEQVLRQSLAHIHPPELEKMQARIAREGLAEHLATLPVKPPVQTYVDGVLGVSEDKVKPYGVIRYEFGFVKNLVLLGYNEAIARSPVGGEGDEHPGLYKKSWRVYADGVSVEPANLPPFPREVWIVNPVDYHRRLEVGKTKAGREWSTQVKTGVAEQVRQVLQRRYSDFVSKGVISINREFVRLPDPYKLVRGSPDNSERARHQGKAGRLSPREGRKAGDDMTYPAVVIRVL